MRDELAFVAEVTGAEGARQRERIQSLWSGYGEIVRVALTGAEQATVIVKAVQPPSRARQGDRSHARKCRSYDVETTFYRSFAEHCDDACRVPRSFGSRAGNDAWLFVLEDLDAAGFCGRRHAPRGPELDACLGWLAAFHARFLFTPPTGLWKTGTYWHLATRPDELLAIDDAALREAAPRLDRALREATFQTLVHGDAKPANFCFGTRGHAVAAVDFQYVGGGCGMKDVAYLLASPRRDDADAEPHRLDTYFRRLRAEVARRSTQRGVGVDVDLLEREWRALYPLAKADYYRFLAGWAKEHYRSDLRAQHVVRDVLRALT